MNGAQSSAASTHRPLKARMRPDLVCVPQMHGAGAEVVWIVKDPVALQYAAFGSEEFALLNLLDGVRSPLAVCRDFERQFVPRRLRLADLGAFVARMHALGLILSDAPDQGARLLERRTTRKRWAGAFSVLNVLAIRFRGFDADRFLGWLARQFHWAFRPGWLLAFVVLMCSALVLASTHPGAGSDAWPGMDELLRGDQLLWMMAAVGIAKVLHELGHGIACKHFGGECHEIGVMLLVFVPCLYCNVTDAWMMPDKRRRIAVSAAGIFVELLLAAVCAYVWRFTEPGFWNRLAFTIMVLSSLNTLLLNGNPLLRYDGYYVLSDLWGIPNLAQQSSAAVRNVVFRGLGIDTENGDANKPGGISLVVYGVLSAGYRLLVLAGILWMLHRALAPRGLGSLSILLGGMAIAGMTAAPAMQAARMWRSSMVRRPVNRRRLLPALIGASVLGGALLFVPVPQHARAPFVIEPMGAQPVYARTAGRLMDAVATGAAVESGAVVARLENIDLELQLAELQGRRERQQARIASLERRRSPELGAMQELPEAREALLALDRQLSVLQQSLDRLTLVAAADGIVIPPPAVDPDPESLEPPPLSPIETDQRGRLIPAGTLLCEIANPHRLQAVLLIGDDAIGQVSAGQPVTLQADAVPLRRLTGVISRIARQDTAARQANNASWSRLLWEDEAADSADAESTRYEAIVQLDDPDPRLRIGSRGAALITVRSEPLGLRMYRALRRAFGLRM